VSAPLKTENSKSKTAAVPACWRGDVQRVLITNARLERRIRAMAREIERDFRGRETVIISLLNGTVVFLADLIRQLTLPLRLDFIGVSSYGSGTESGALVFTKELRLDVRGCDVLLVDDILDTGKTMSRVLPKIRALKPRRIKTCVLLDKPSRRAVKIRRLRRVHHSRFLCRRLRVGLCRALPQPAVHWRVAPARLRGAVWPAGVAPWFRQRCPFDHFPVCTLPVISRTSLIFFRCMKARRPATTCSGVCGS